MMRPELLAPVGGESQLTAAIRFGADAVYMGGKKFGLRAYAGNFDDDMMKRAVDYVHFHGKKIYVTVNAYMYNNDLDGVAETCRELESIGVDAAIVADPATIEIAQEVAPKLPLHLSTQANTLNWRAASFWHRNGECRRSRCLVLTVARIFPEHRDSGCCAILEVVRIGNHVPSTGFP